MAINAEGKREGVGSKWRGQSEKAVMNEESGGKSRRQDSLAGFPKQARLGKQKVL